MYIKRLAEIFVQKALLLFEILSFEVYCRSDSDSPTRRYGESATPRLTVTGSWRLPDSPIRRVCDSLTHRCGESTKGKIIALHLYVCLLLQASLVPSNGFLGSLTLSLMAPCAPPCPTALGLIGPEKKEEQTGFDDVR